MINDSLNLDEVISKLKEIVSLLEDIETKTVSLPLKFVGINEFADVIGWSKKTVQDLYNRPDFPSTNFGKEKKAEIHAIINYFSVPRRK